MGGTCAMHVKKGKMHITFWSENIKRREHLEDPDVEQRYR
jgi:hypothetical protein